MQQPEQLVADLRMVKKHQHYVAHNFTYIHESLILNTSLST